MTVRDNVIELRKIRHADTLVERIIHGAAAEIERLREESERLREERDEARKLWCHAMWLIGGKRPNEQAKAKGWDCFEDTIR